MASTAGPIGAFLERLRGFRSPPGRPAEALGVPAAAGRDLAAELAPVFAHLDEIEAEADRTLVAARRRAQVELAAADREASAVRAAAIAGAPRVRRRAAAEHLRAARPEIREIGEDAERAAARVRARAAERIPDLVRAVLDDVRELTR